MTLMTETVASIAKPVPRPRSAKPATVSVSASALALHLDCSRAYIGKLEADGVIQRQGDGFPLDQSRVAYLRYLRRKWQQSTRFPHDLPKMGRFQSPTRFSLIYVNVKRARAAQARSHDPHAAQYFVRGLLKR
jgi:hypothetical protein